MLKVSAYDRLRLHDVFQRPHFGVPLRPISEAEVRSFSQAAQTMKAAVRRPAAGVPSTIACARRSTEQGGG